MRFNQIPASAKTWCLCAALAAGLPSLDTLRAANYHPADTNENFIVERQELEALFTVPEWRQDLETKMLRAVQLYNAGGYQNGSPSMDGFLAASLNYVVLDLVAGTVEYLDDAPAGGWSDEYKTDKLVLRRIPAGTFTMGSPATELGRNANETQREVTLTRDFFIGVFQVTQRQWELVMGTTPGYFKNPACYMMRPVENISHANARGAGADPTANSFLGRLRTQFASDMNLQFELPTEAQWEYACRAGTTTALNSGTNLTVTGNQSPYACANLNKVARYLHNPSTNTAKPLNTAGLEAGTAVVGSYAPNAWGLYDMHGNVWERCLDVCALNNNNNPAALPSTAASDPVGASGSYHVLRGGAWNLIASQARSARRYHDAVTADVLSNIGLRVCAPMPLQFP